MSKKIAYHKERDGKVFYYTPYTKLEMLKYLAKYAPTLVANPDFNPNLPYDELEDLLNDYTNREIIGFEPDGRAVVGPVIGPSSLPMSILRMGKK